VFDWTWTDRAMAAVRSNGIEPIVDLLHYGLPDDLWGFGDPRFPDRFAAYAAAFAERYPWVRYYTPVNEPLVGATFAALRGFWNECLSSERAFVTAIRNLCMAHELAVDAILAERPDAIIVQSESLEHFHSAGRASQSRADRENAFKYLSLDLTLGHELPPGMAGFLNENGVSSNDLSFFREKRAPGQRWLGTDYYPTCEHVVATSGRTTTKWKGLGYYSLARAYYERYRIPLFHCETNRVNRLAVDWLQSQWSAVNALQLSGIPVHGFTWYSLTDQIDWQYGLRVERNDLHPVGLYDLSRRPRPVAGRYREIVANWGAALSTAEAVGEASRAEA